MDSLIFGALCGIFVLLVFIDKKLGKVVEAIRSTKEGSHGTV